MICYQKKLIDSSYLARYFLLNSVDISDYTVFLLAALQIRHPSFTFRHPSMVMHFYQFSTK